MNEKTLLHHGLYPRSSLPAYIPDSECKVYEALASVLPAGWSAWHSIKIRIMPREFAEADLVIANPLRGILVLEVKGGIVRKHDGVWFQNEKPMSMSPLDQAHRFKRILLEKGNEREIALPRSELPRSSRTRHLRTSRHKATLRDSLWACESWPAAMNFLARCGVGRALEGLRLRHGDRRRGPGLRQA